MKKRRNCSLGAISPLFHIILSQFHFKTGTRFSLRDKRWFEISEFEITRFGCRLVHIISCNACSSYYTHSWPKYPTESDIFIWCGKSSIGRHYRPILLVRFLFIYLLFESIFFKSVQNSFKRYNTSNTPFTAHTKKRPLWQTVQTRISQLTVHLSGPAVPNQHNLSHGKLIHGRNNACLTIHIILSFERVR